MEHAPFGLPAGGPSSGSVRGLSTSTSSPPPPHAADSRPKGTTRSRRRMRRSYLTLVSLFPGNVRLDPGRHVQTRDPVGARRVECVFFFLMIRRPPRSTPFPTRRSSDLFWFAGNNLSKHLFRLYRKSGIIQL